MTSTNYTFELTGKVPSKKNQINVTKFGGFYRNQAYVNWEETAIWELLPQIRSQSLISPIDKEIILDVEFYTDKRSDLDNMLGTIFDLLQKAFIVANDKLIMKVKAKKIISKELRAIIKITSELSGDN